MKTMACAIYTRKSSEEGLEQDFNSLDAQREACQAFILSQKAQGWKALPGLYDDGGFSGGSLERPALKRLMEDVAAGRVQIIVVYKVDRLTRSLADFAKLVELFDARGVSFVSVTQQFNTTSSMGRLTLNVLLSFAQFEREVTGERIRDKIAASKRKGLWMGGMVPIGYRAAGRTLAIDEVQAERVRAMYQHYLSLGCVRRLQEKLAGDGWLTPVRTTERQDARGGRPFSRGHLYRILSNPIYIGRIAHRGQVFEGQHPAVVDAGLWDAVQQKLAANRTGARRSGNSKAPSLLAGFVFDGDGGRLTPSHAKKGSRRYRYYVGPGEAGNAMRIPAQELEEAVIGLVTRWLADEAALVVHISADPTSVQAGLAAARRLREMMAGPARSAQETIDRIVHRVTVKPKMLQVAVKPAELMEATDRPPITLEAAVALKRRGMAMRLVVGGESALKRRADPNLMTLVRKGQEWLRWLTTGEVKGVQDIADRMEVGPSYVTRLLHVGMLAPDIVQAIMTGDHPPELTSDRLQRLVPLPVSWVEQRVLFGFSGARVP